MKVSHEVPLRMLSNSRSFNDYDYALVHLFGDYPEYHKFYKESLMLGREVILDNSLFELGKAWDSNLFIQAIKDLQPTYYIIPDSFDNYYGTIKLFDDFLLKIKSLKTDSKKIGVIHGRSLDEYIACYKHIEPFVDKVAISFGYSYYQEVGVGNINLNRMLGRYRLISDLLKYKIINTNKPHHLLGGSLPQEFSLYRHKLFSFINTIDTSSPVVHGIQGIKYQNYGLDDKSDIKMIDFFEHDIVNMDIIEYNIGVFRTFVK